MTRFETKGWIGAAATVLALGTMAGSAAAQTRAVARIDTVGGDTLSIRVGRQGSEVVRYREGGEEVITIRRKVDSDGRRSDDEPLARRDRDNDNTESDDNDDRHRFNFSIGDDGDDSDNDGDGEMHVYRNEAGDTVRVERRVRRRRSGRHYRINNWRWNRDENEDRFAASNGMFGGVDAVYQQLHGDEFNRRLAPAGLQFNEDQLLLGGGIYIQGDHIRLGYTGSGWTREETRLDFGVKRTATLRLGYGAFTGEYVWGFGHHRVELGLGGVIGQGRVLLGINRQVGGDPSFDDVVGGIVADSVGRYTTTLETRPFIIGPRASLRLHVVGPFSVMASGAYLFGQSDKWKQNRLLFDDKGLDVVAGPTYKFNQPVVQVGLYFGS